MLVAFRDTVEIDTERRFDVFALAGKLEVYKNGMRMRDAVKALMARCGTDWATQLETTYPIGEFAHKKSAKRKPRKEVPIGGTK